MDEWVSDSYAYPWVPFFSIGCLVQPQYNGFCFYLIIFYFVMFGCRLLEACSFLLRDRNGGIQTGVVVVRNWEK